MTSENKIPFEELEDIAGQGVNLSDNEILDVATNLTEFNISRIKKIGIVPFLSKLFEMFTNGIYREKAEKSIRKGK